MRAAARQARRRQLRHGLLQLSFLLAVGLVLGRAFQLQVVQGERWRTRAVAQHEERVPLPAPRGAIYDREGRELVVSRTTYRVSVAPLELRNRRAAAEVLQGVLKLRPQTVRRVAQGDRRWLRLPGTHSALRKEKLEEQVEVGVYFEPVVERFYPRGQLAAEIIGRVDANGRGQSGLELSFDSLLAGQPGFGVERQDATGKAGTWLLTPLVSPTAGADLRLTIDAELQALAESVLEDAVGESDARGGDLLILDPRTGELLAAASRRPGDGGRYPHLMAATEPYEAGSTLKPFTVAALLAEELADLEDVVNTGRGLYRTAGRTIHDDRPHGRVTLAQALAVSSNVAMALFAERLPEGLQFSYLRGFGFGTPTGVAYPSESPGRLRRPAEWSAQSRASLAIGYEVSVTPLQLVMAYGAIANGGILMRPQLVREVRAADGAQRWKMEPERIRRVLPKAVTVELREALAHAVTQGTGRSAGVRGLSVAGKTGTTNDVRDNWTMGYSNNIVVGVWVGSCASHPGAGTKPCAR